MGGVCRENMLIFLCRAPLKTEGFRDALLYGGKESRPVFKRTGQDGRWEHIAAVFAVKQ
jgi:hypothetical protein